MKYFLLFLVCIQFVWHVSAFSNGPGTCIAEPADVLPPNGMPNAVQAFDGYYLNFSAASYTANTSYIVTINSIHVNSMLGFLLYAQTSDGTPVGSFVPQNSGQGVSSHCSQYQYANNTIGHTSADPKSLPYILVWRAPASLKGNLTFYAASLYNASLGITFYNASFPQSEIIITTTPSPSSTTPLPVSTTPSPASTTPTSVSTTSTSASTTPTSASTTTSPKSSTTTQTPSSTITTSTPIATTATTAKGVSSAVNHIPDVFILGSTFCAFFFYHAFKFNI